MNKLKSTFSLRRNKDTEKRSQTFIKKLSLQKDTSTTPYIDITDLSPTESDTYLAWWKDLDPFDIGKADNKAIFNFISGSNLPTKTLEEILKLFQDEKDGLNKNQFFAMLRLISHAQHGRTVQRDLVYLGAPMPRLQTPAIDALIKPSPEITCDTIDSSQIPSWMITVPQTPQSTRSNLRVQGNHSRSRSVPYASTESLSPTPSTIKRHSGHASLNHESIQNIINTSKPLLLTQSFKPDFIEDEIKNPFDSTESLIYTPNTKSNNENIPPPPVPSQSTKPPFPKYARR